MRSESPNQVAAASLSKADDQAIRKTVSGFEEAWNAHDMKAFAKLFREDADWVNVVGMHWRGRDAVVAATTAFHETILKTNQMKLDSVETRSLGTGYAIAVATVTQDGFTAPDGKIFPRTQDRETFVRRRSQWVDDRPRSQHARGRRARTHLSFTRTGALRASFS